MHGPMQRLGKLKDTRGAAAAASQEGTSGAGTFGRLGPLFAGVPATQPENGLPCGGLQASNARHWVNSVVDGMGWQRHKGEPSRYRAGPEGSSGNRIAAVPGAPAFRAAVQFR